MPAAVLVAAGCLAQVIQPAQAPANLQASAQALTWQQIQELFRANNPNLLAGQASVEESRAQEITAFLRPNPEATFGWDQINPFTTNPYRPLSQSYIYWSVSYLHEREHKRELRLASAKDATGIAGYSQADLERNLMFKFTRRVCAGTAGQGDCSGGKGES
jgi:cobalt-zinc-cadmium efflux system outer membrane protein